MSTHETSGPLLDPSTPRSERLIGLFRVHARLDFEEVDSAIASGDVVRIQRQVHRLKGAASSFGATALAECAATLERTARNGEIPSGASRGELKELLQATLHEVESGL
jgi:HPt (histidine-containing phosphotransfer) domain-containing protein